MDNSSTERCLEIDNTFGPYAGSCRGGFDFTLYFEDTILTILPVVVLLILAPARLLYLRTTRPKVVRSRWRFVKLTGYASLAALNFAALILWIQPMSIASKASVAAAGLSFVGAILLGLLSYVEHNRSVKPSLILELYLLFTLLFDIAHARTLWLQQYNRSHAVLFILICGIKGVSLLLESQQKRHLLRPAYETCPPEALAGTFNRWTFWWLNSLFKVGFKANLDVDDLYPLDKSLQSEHLDYIMQTSWHRVTRQAADQSSSSAVSKEQTTEMALESKIPEQTTLVKKTAIPANALFGVAFKTLIWPIVAAVPYRVALIAFTFCQPLLIDRAITLSNEFLDKQSRQIGYGLIGAYVIVYSGIAVTTGQSQHLSYRTITMARGGLISMIYRKATNLQSTSTDPASALTLMSADIERITTGWQMMHDLWACIIEIVLAIYLLQRQLGAACAIPIGVSIFAMFGAAATTSLVLARQTAWLQAIEKRISATTAMLGAMKGVKMCGLKDTLQRRLQELRKEEMEISKGFRKLQIYTMAFSYITPVGAPILTFAVFSVTARNAGGNTTLDTARVFTSLSLFTLLSEPIQSFMQALVTFMGAVGSFQRIQQFLEAEEHKDYREKPGETFDAGSIHSVRKKSISEQSEISAAKTMSTEKLDFGLMLQEDRCYYNMPEAIIIQEGNFGWTEESTPVLKHVNLSVPREKVTMLIGPVGCGKSTLLKAILGELPTVSGRVGISSSSIAYCNQTPWHMNSTVQESIVGITCRYDEKWYHDVVEACALDEDFAHLPQGDQTVIGSNGVALSGGQSQRIALARAVYGQRDIVLLDDVFCSLDQDTENKVFHNLLGKNGILRRKRATIVLASSSAQRVPYADHIVAINQSGFIGEQGSFHTLNRSGGYVSSFNLQPTDWAHASVRRSFTEKTAGLFPPITHAKEELPNVVSVDAENARRTSDIAVYGYYIRAIGWMPAIIFVLGIMSFVFCYTFPSIWVKWWAAANIETPNGNLGYWLGIYAVLGLSAIVSLLIATWQIIITAVPRSGVAFHEKILKTVLNAPMRFFSTTDTGVTINRFSQDLQLIDMDLPVNALQTFTVVVMCIAQMVLIGVASAYAAISFPICVIVLYLVQKFYLRTSRQLRFLDLEAKSPLMSELVECLGGLATIRAFCWQDALQVRVRGLLDRSQRPFYLLFAVQRWITLVLDLMVAAVAVLLISLVVNLRGQLSAGYVGVAMLNVIMFSQYIKQLVVFWTMLETNIGAIARIKSFTEDTADEHQQHESQQPPAVWPSKGSIEFKNVSASYKPPSNVLENLDLSIQPGQKVAICGRTGSGKSSLMLTLFRMLDQTSGSLIIDGIDIATIPRQTVRSRIIGVPQDAYLFPGTVQENASPTGTAAESDIIEALESVQLWNIISEKGGLSTLVEDCHFSQGQKQLFCLARAMLRPGRILVLDEATSSVDAQTEVVIQDVLRTKFAYHTVITVAHKLDSILDFDRVAMMEGGRIVEYDAPYSLLSQPESKFAQLYHSAEESEST
ncbi:canalicular multispecific organic anion transporter 1 [Pseudovirgaria hyperparasitica]|uniref:Canalicular multispecific organic anion transporter 1 n=1 Tax=Pseudovirgaria hyperparasitica TaxID=470096 RepID=A0A6A6W3Q5_9PEZI|nr:canalicular multispecific organic anion transporter 1 [Pseudovirgaria hyperparasitica]KAF2757243.1 canalicular multispecific organic anion transporter 1 [Pseudovirgaria hyperparasitica]